MLSSQLTTKKCKCQRNDRCLVATSKVWWWSQETQSAIGRWIRSRKYIWILCIGQYMLMNLIVLVVRVGVFVAFSGERCHCGCLLSLSSYFHQAQCTIKRLTLLLLDSILSSFWGITVIAAENWDWTEWDSVTREDAWFELNEEVDIVDACIEHSRRKTRWKWRLDCRNDVLFDDVVFEGWAAWWRHYVLRTF